MKMIKFLCTQWQLVETNQISATKMKWMTEKFLNPSVDNFHHCDLQITFRDDVDLLFSKYNYTQNGNFNVEGALVKMIEIFQPNSTSRLHISQVSMMVAWFSAFT